MKGLFALLPLVITSSVWSQSLASRAESTYLATDRNVDLDCAYSMNKTYKLVSPLGETRWSPGQLSRSFIIEDGLTTMPLEFRVYLHKGMAAFETKVGGESAVGNLRRRSFNLFPLKNLALSSAWEIPRIHCSVNVADAAPFVLEDGDYHFSVHPQKEYDWQSKLKLPVEKHLADPSYRQVIFLETGNNRGGLVDLAGLLQDKTYVLPVKKFESDITSTPLPTSLVVSPAGNSRFEIKGREEIRILFSGGNHNYCIWNVARHVIEDLMNSHSSAEVQFNYDTAAIVAQIKGIEQLNMNFPRININRSNLLRDLLQDPKIAVPYHAAYLDYFTGYLAREYSGMYASYRVIYNAPGFQKEVVLQGAGQRDLTVTFTYQ